MRPELKTKTTSLAGASDLTIVATIKKGFIPSLDAVTYKTRVKRVLKALHLGRSTAHEYDLARVLSDAVERVGRIHSIRITIIEPGDKVMLAVTFDGSWESYIRVIWQKVSRSLDLIFCNTEDYVPGWTSTYEQWNAWLRRSQAETLFLYSPPGLTYKDTQFLQMQERALRRNSDLAQGDLEATQIQIPTAEDIGDAMCRDATDPSNMGLNTPQDLTPTGRPAFRQGVRSLAGLYRLAELYLPGTDDGTYLHRAATELLREFVPMVKHEQVQYQRAIERAKVRFKDALDWLTEGESDDRSIPDLQTEQPKKEFADVQGGIVESYVDITEGCLLFVAFDTPFALGEFLSANKPTSANDALEDGDIAVNMALTIDGLRLAGLTDDEVATLPEEFVQGMARRAGMLGDVRINHPRRWRHPTFNWNEGVNAKDVSEAEPGPRLDFSAVHLVLQLRICQISANSPAARRALYQKLEALTSGKKDVRRLSLQWMHRLTNDKSQTREHFGFLDSQSQPVFSDAEEGRKYPNHINLGEVLLGYDNAADHALPQAHLSDMQKLLRNGSYLVVRKLRQDVGVLEDVLSEAIANLLPGNTDLSLAKAQRELLLAKMMGRWPDGATTAGKALILPVGKGGDNDFNFNVDVTGAQCPFHAHIRRANPRDTSIAEPPGSRPARLVRRGMSYGPAHDLTETDLGKAKESLGKERGLVFMAYNASIGEQFEVVQRWLTGGNSSGSNSGQSDPFLGVAEPGRRRFFKFEHDSNPIRIALDGSDQMHDEPQPIVRLEWGMYLLTPSISALQTLAKRAKKAAKTTAKSWSSDSGEREIERLRDIEKSEGDQVAFTAWKAILEDPGYAADFTTASIWAAIRENHGGVLRTPFGILVASRELIDGVLNDPAGNLTATGYLPRMRRSFGALYLGMDAGQADGIYELESAAVNKAIMDLTLNRTLFDAAVGEAANETQLALGALAQQAIGYAQEDCETRWEVTFDAREIIDKVLAHFCETWFGLSDEQGLFQNSGYRWNWKPSEPPCYPGHFMAPSRYIFQPHPGPEVERIGAEHGKALQKAMTEHLTKNGKTLKALVARAALDCAAAAADATFPARALLGVMMGFVPTTDGNMRRVFNEWLNDGTFWSLRALHQTIDASDAAAAAAFEKQFHTKFITAMQLRAAPELLWRTASASHAIGEPGANQVAVRTGEIVIASLISATQQCREQGDPSLSYAFGGSREPPRPNPTHACPGYGPASAVMLGFFRGLVKSDWPLRPGPAPLTVSMDGFIELSQECQTEADTMLAATEISVPNIFSDVTLTFTRTTSIPVMTIGDSWLFKIPLASFKASSLATELAELNYAMDNRFCKTGQTLSQMAATNNLKLIKQRIADLSGTPKEPRAILISGGGNDIVNPPDKPKLTRLFSMLNEGATTVDSALIKAEVTTFIDVELSDHYRALFKAITEATDAPVIVHAYDHPIPDGRFFDLFGDGWDAGPWLIKVFEEKKIVNDLGIRAGIMKVLIEALNVAVEKVAAEFAGKVYYVKFAGVLASQADFSQDYQTYWANELHPEKLGFKILAEIIHKKLLSLGVK